MAEREAIEVAKRSWLRAPSTLKRLLKEAIRLGRRADRAGGACAADRQAPDCLSKRRRIQERYESLVAAQYADPDAQRLLKRLIHYRSALFTFLDNPDVPCDNNHAEREQERGNRNRATLAVARKLVARLLAVDKRHSRFMTTRSVHAK
ncbi:MAG: transposase [Candidatus Sumerlaeota bacterium]|nr:transposase [Candidatus Sumerlaeota bacterium]